MRGKAGVLSPRGRLWAWVGLVVLAAYAPLTASLMPDDSWLLSVTVATMIGVVIIADDNERGKAGGRVSGSRKGSAPDEG